MPRKKKSKEEVQSESEISDWDESFGLPEILSIMRKHKHFDTFLRDERIFESGLFECMQYARALWDTRHCARDRARGVSRTVASSSSEAPSHS